MLANTKPRFRLAHYVEWHMREKLAPILFEDDEKEAAARLRRSIVAPAVRSAVAKQNDASKRTDDNYPVHSFQTLLTDLATLATTECASRRAKRSSTNLPKPPQPSSEPSTCSASQRSQNSKAEFQPNLLPYMEIRADFLAKFELIHLGPV